MINFYRDARATAYHLVMKQDSENLEKLIDGMRNGILLRETILEGIEDGIELAQLEKTTMTEETVHPDYKRGFNLAHILMTNGGEEQYKELADSCKDLPGIQDKELFKGMGAGKRQAEKDIEHQMSEQYKDYLKTSFGNNRDDITHMTFEEWRENIKTNEREAKAFEKWMEEKERIAEWENENYGPDNGMVFNDGPKHQPLNEQQQKEAQAFLDRQDIKEQQIQDNISERKSLNTRMEEGKANSDFVEDETEKKRQEFMKKFQERGKGGKDHER